MLTLSERPTSTDHSNMPSISYLELAVRYTHCLWATLHELRVKVPAAAHRLSGVSLPLTTGPQDTGESEKEPFQEASMPVRFDRSFILTWPNGRLDLSTCNSS